MTFSFLAIYPKTSNNQQFPAISSYWLYSTIEIVNHNERGSLLKVTITVAMNYGQRLRAQLPKYEYRIKTKRNKDDQEQKSMKKNYGHNH